MPILTKKELAAFLLNKQKMKDESREESRQRIFKELTKVLFALQFYVERYGEPKVLYSPEFSDVVKMIRKFLPRLSPEGKAAIAAAQKKRRSEGR